MLESNFESLYEFSGKHTLGPIPGVYLFAGEVSLGGIRLTGI